jgi:alpha-L-fucosidase 2
MDAMKMGKNKEAEELCRLMQGPYTQSYQPLGELILIFKDTSPLTNFYRELDISESLARVKLKIGNENPL